MVAAKGLSGGKVTPEAHRKISAIVLLVYLLANGADGTDVTHPDANKGAIARHPSAKYAIPPKTIATIGDMRNDALMFASAADPCLVTRPVSGGCRGARRRAGRGRRAA